MIEPFRRLVQRMADGLVPGREGASPLASGGAAHPEADNPLVRITHAAQDVLAAVEQQLDATRRVDDGLREIEGQAARAWRERESLTQDYYALVRGVLQVLDDCRALGSGTPGVETVCAGLESLLRAQGVEPIPLAVGDRFQAATQCCEETANAAMVPPGTVLRVLAAGYRRRMGDGTVVIVRPARVVVSQAGEGKESQP